MQIKKIKSNKKFPTKIILIIISILIVLGLGAFALYKTGVIKLPTDKPTDEKNKVSNEVNLEPPTDEQTKIGEEIKETSSDVQNTNLSVAISSTYIDSGLLHIKAIINGVITSNGTCDLLMTRKSDSITISKSASTYAMPSYSTCQGFDIDINELGVGEWNAKLTVTINGESVSTDKNVTIE